MTWCSLIKYLQIIIISLQIISLQINSTNSDQETGLKFTPDPNTGLSEGLDSNTYVPSQINFNPDHQHQQQEKKGENTGKRKFPQFGLDDLHNTQRIRGKSYEHTHASADSEIRKTAVKDAIPGTPRTVKKVNPGALNYPQKKLGELEDTTTTATIDGRKTRKPGDQSKGKIEINLGEKLGKKF